MAYSDGAEPMGDRVWYLLYFERTKYLNGHHSCFADGEGSKILGLDIGLSSNL